MFRKGDLHTETACSGYTQTIDLHLVKHSGTGSAVVLDGWITKSAKGPYRMVGDGIRGAFSSMSFIPLWLADSTLASFLSFQQDDIGGFRGWLFIRIAKSEVLVW